MTSWSLNSSPETAPYPLHAGEKISWQLMTQRHQKLLQAIAAIQSVAPKRSEPLRLLTWIGPAGLGR